MSVPSGENATVFTAAPANLVQIFGGQVDIWQPRTVRTVAEA